MFDGQTARLAQHNASPMTRFYLHIRGSTNLFQRTSILGTIYLYENTYDWVLLICTRPHYESTLTRFYLPKLGSIYLNQVLPTYARFYSSELDPPYDQILLICPRPPGGWGPYDWILSALATFYTRFILSKIDHPNELVQLICPRRPL